MPPPIGMSTTHSPGSTQAKPETSTSSEKLRETAKRFQIGRATERIEVISGKTQHAAVQYER